MLVRRNRSNYLTYNVYFRLQPTILHLFPAQLSEITNSSNYGISELESVDTVTCGGVPITPVLIDKLIEKAGIYIFFQEFHGMTELSPRSMGLRPESKNRKVGSKGTLWPG